MIKKTVVYVWMLLCSTAGIAEEYYYIYKDDKGRTYIEDSVSDNHAKYGYRIVNSQGATVKTVPGSEELRARDEKRRKRSAAQDAKKAEREQDAYLLQSFVDVEDIRIAGNKKIMAIQAQIDTTNNHIKAFEENLAQLEEQIHRADINKQEVTQEEVNSIKSIKESIHQNKQYVLRRIEQQQQVRQEYIEYMKRFQELKSKN